MDETRRLSVRVGFVMGMIAMAAGLAAAGDTVADPPSVRQFIPPRRAKQFLLHDEMPDYPSIAKMNYIQGKVEVETCVDGSGEVKEAHVVKGHPFLAVAALKAIKNWVYKPAKLRQGPDRFTTFVDVKFSLRVRKIGHIPDQPEAYLSRQVRPPQLKETLLEQAVPHTVRVKILVGPDGHALDSVALEERGQDLQEARQVIASWTFDPARWGAIPVPWYIEVDVPVGAGPTDLSPSPPAESPAGLDNCR